MDTQSELRGSSPVNTESFTHRFNKVLQQHPDALAVISTHQPATLYGFDSCKKDANRPPYLRWTYSTLSKAVSGLVGNLTARGVSRGTPFFAFCPNQVEYVIAVLAAFNLGLVYVPMNPEALARADEVQYMVDTVTAHETSEQVIVLANTASEADKIDNNLTLKLDALKIIAANGNTPDNGWICMDTLVGHAQRESRELDQPMDEREEISVMFTSGSTSLPKGCRSSATRWFNTLEPSLCLGSTNPGNTVAMTVPNYHAYGFISTMLPLVRGACVVFTGPKFSPQETIAVMKQEQCSHAAMVPTMIHSIADVLAFSGERLESLKTVLFAAMALTQQTLSKCNECFGRVKVENFYGMTEGVFLSTGATENLDEITQEQEVAVGKPINGAKIKVCAPESGWPLKKGTPGHLHFSGHSLIPHYLGIETDEIYEMDGEKWFVTGDQAMVGHDNRVYFVGRYKDMIIRGGENISPSRIEAVLAETPEFHALEPHIVAAVDSVAGEVPFAVVKKDILDELKSQIRNTIRSALGVAYVPGKIASLAELGLDQYPTTSSGKVQKTKLRELVKKCDDSPESEMGKHLPSPEKLGYQVKRVWARTLGVQVGNLDMNCPISHVADSIIMLSARDRAQKETGRSVPLPEWLAASTITDHIDLLHRSTVNQTRNTSTREKRERPLEAGDLVRTVCKESSFLATKAATEKIISPLNLTWDDVTDIVPCSNFIQTICRSQAINTWNIRTSILSKSASAQQMRHALERTLANNPLMLSFMVINPDLLAPEQGFYAIIRPQRIFDQCIIDHGTVETLQDLRTIIMKYPFPDHTRLPGPLFRALVVFVKERNSAALITNASHSLLDIIYHRLFNEDIDSALSGRSLHPHVPFKAFADSFSTLRQTPEAEKSINFHVEYLRDLPQHRHALWPLETHNLTVSPEREDKDGHVTTFIAPSFVNLREKYPQLTTPIVLKAALTLLVISHTNHTHALFVNLEACRSRFPFHPISDTNTDASDVAGPTFTGVLNLIEYKPQETVLEFLMRIQHMQTLLSEHANAPWYEVLNRLDLAANEIIPAVAESLIFNWMPGLGAAALGESPFDEMDILQTHIRTKLGMLASAGAGGPDGSHIVIFLQGAVANMSTVWVERIAEDMKRIALWLAEEKSWAESVGGFVDCLGR